MNYLLKLPARLTMTLVLVAAVVLAISCGGDSVTKPDEVATALVISPATLHLVPGATSQLSVSARMGAGGLIFLHTADWSSSDTKCVAIRADGLAAALAPGSATLTVRSGDLAATMTVIVDEGGIALPGGSIVAASNGSASLTIPAGAVSSPASIQMTPVTVAATSRSVGAAVAITADIASFTQPVTITLTYGVPSAAVTSSDANATPSLYRMTGSVWVPVPGSRTDAAAHSVSAPITALGTFALLLPQITTSIVVSQPSASLSEESTQRATAQVLDQLSVPIIDAPVSWSSSDASVAEINDSTGIIRALRTGTTTIRAMRDDVNASATLIVTPAAVSTITLAFTGNTVAVGAQTSATATVRSASGAVLSGRTVSFSSSAPSVATINALGVVTGVSVGSATISATSEGVSVSTTITVVPAVAGVPVSATIVTGNNQTQSALGRPAVDPAVLVRDALGNPLSNVSVTFSVSGGSGSMSGSSSGTVVVPTAIDGVATLTAWRLGSRAGTNTLTATVGVLPPLVFTATATVVLTLDFNIYSTILLPGGILPGVNDVNVPKAEVTITSTHPVTATVRAAGQTAVLSPEPFRLNGCVRCWLGAIDMSHVSSGSYWFVFEAVDTIGTHAADSVQYIVAARTDLIAVTLSNPSLAVGATAQASAQLRDAAGNVLPTVTPTLRPVVWTSTNPAVATVSSLGLVTAVGNGSVSIVASRDGKSGSATLVVAAGAPVPATLTRYAGDNQTLSALGRPPVSPAVLVTNAGGNPLSNVAVMFTVSGGGGSILTTTNDTLVVQTNTSGVATLSYWRLGSRAGANALKATVGGVSITFTATATVTLTLDFTILNQTQQTAGGLLPGATDVNIPKAQATIVSTHPAVATVRGAGQTGTLTKQAFQLNGCVNCWLGSIDLTPVPAGTYWFVFEVVDTIGTRAKDSVQFTVVRVSAIDASLANAAMVIGGTTQATAILRDAAGNVMPATAPTLRPVAWSTSNGAVATVSAAGAVTATGAGTADIIASRDGKTGRTTVTVSAGALVAASVTKISGDNQSGVVLGFLHAPLSVLVRDAAGNPIGNAAVTFAVTAGSGTLTGPGTIYTNTSGVAVFFDWQLGPRGGTHTITASANGGASATFTATALLSLVVDFNIQWVGAQYVGGLRPGSVDVSIPITEARVVSNSPYPTTLTARGAGRTGALTARPFQLNGCHYCWLGSIDLRGVAPGTYWFVFEAQDTIGTRSADSVQFTVAPLVNTITARVTNPSLVTGSTTQASSTLFDASGNVLPDNATTRRPVVWTSSNTAVARVSATGVVTGAGPGSAMITAARDGAAGGVAVTVSSPVPSP
jgi:uncharacterized protein YjdB